RPDRVVWTTGLLLGGERLDRVGAGVRRPSRGTARGRLLPCACARSASRLPRFALLRGSLSAQVQLRLDVRLLPALLQATRPGDDRISLAQRALRMRP